MKKLFIISALVCSGLSANAQSIGYDCRSDENPDFSVNCELDYMHRTATIIKDNRIEDNYYSVNKILRIPETVKCNGTTYTVVGYKDDVYDQVAFDMVTLPKTLKYAGKLYTHGGSTDPKPVLYLTTLKDWCDVDNYTEVCYSSCYQFTVDMANITAPVIPEGVTKIGSRTFHVYHLTDVTLPSTLRSIGESAFYLTDLSSVTLPEGLLEIGKEAFSYCQNLSTVNLPSTLNELGRGAFQSCKLTSIQLPESIVDIPAECFENNPFVKFEVPSWVETVGAGAFTYCEKLEYFVLGKGVKSVGKGVFDHTTKLKKVICLAEEVPEFDYRQNYYNSSVNSVAGKTLYVPDAVVEDYRADGNWNKFDNILPLSDFYMMTYDVSYTGGTVDIKLDPETKTGCIVSSESVTGYVQLPEKVMFLDEEYTVTSIGERAFQENMNISNVDLPSTLTSIGEYAFFQCTNLSEIVIPDGVTKIDDFAFSGCTGLKKATIGAGVKSIGYNAFNIHSDWTVPQVICKAETVPAAASNAFGNIDRVYTGDLTVPAGCEDDYMATEPWSYFGKVDGDKSQPCSDPTIEIVDGRILLSCPTPGALVYYTIDAQSGGGSSLYDLRIKLKAKASNRADSKEIEVNLVDLLPKDGDMNHDGKRSITDITKLVNVLLGK